MADAIARMHALRNGLFDDRQAVGAAPQDDNADEDLDQGFHTRTFFWQGRGHTQSIHDSAVLTYFAPAR